MHQTECFMWKVWRDECSANNLFNVIMTSSASNHAMLLTQIYSYVPWVLLRNTRPLCRRTDYLYDNSRRTMTNGKFQPTFDNSRRNKQLVICLFLLLQQCRNWNSWTSARCSTVKFLNDELLPFDSACRDWRGFANTQELYEAPACIFVLIIDLWILWKAIQRLS